MFSVYLKWLLLHLNLKEDAFDCSMCIGWELLLLIFLKSFLSLSKELVDILKLWGEAPLKRSFQEALYCIEMGLVFSGSYNCLVLPFVRTVARLEAGAVLSIALAFVGWASGHYWNHVQSEAQGLWMQNR